MAETLLCQRWWRCVTRLLRELPSLLWNRPRLLGRLPLHRRLTSLSSDSWLLLWRLLLELQWLLLELWLLELQWLLADSLSDSWLPVRL